MIPLNNSILSRADVRAALPRYDRSRLKAGIVHIGVGNFHRSHQAVYVDNCLEDPGAAGWAIIGVGLNDGQAARAKAAAFRAQDGLYTLTAFRPDGGATTRVIGAIIGYLHAPSDPEAVLRRLTDPDTRIVTLTITEGGYNIDEATGTFRLEAPAVARELAGGPPRTVFAYLTEALARRRAAGLPGFTIASCDNLRGSGDTSRVAVTGFARARDPTLADWIEANVDFPNSMVDRLAPQVPEAERVRLNELSGIDDGLPVFTEAFSQWVVEDRFRHGRPPLETAGVEFRDDVAEYLSMKGRLVNGAHVLLAYPALLMGYRLVPEALADPSIIALVDTFLNRDAKPGVKGPAGVSLDRYVEGFVPRFASPAIPDQLLRVASDGCAKLPIYHEGTLRSLVERGADLRREAFLFACFQRYLRFAFDAALVDESGRRFDPVEPNLGSADRDLIRDGEAGDVLRLAAFRGSPVSDDKRFRLLVTTYGRQLVDRGVAATIRTVVG